MRKEVDEAICKAAEDIATALEHGDVESTIRQSLRNIIRETLHEVFLNS